MVNVLKRMRGLQPLFQIRHGEGAAVLPPPPLPQLTRLNLQYDRQQWNKSTRPARIFQKEHLPRLKYHNPGLPIGVEQGPARLQLTFESTDRDALAELQKTSLDKSIDGEFRTTWSDIQQKPQATGQANTSPPSSTTNAAFVREVELTLGPHQPASLWRWFQTTTKCDAFPENPEENEQIARLNEFFAQAEIDRQRVKAGMDAKRQQRAELESARAAAARMTTED